MGEEKIIRTLSGMGRTQVNGEKIETETGFPGAVREERSGTKDLGDQATSTFSSTNIYYFPPLWKKLQSIRAILGKLMNENRGHGTSRGIGEHHPGPKRRRRTTRRQKINL